MWKYYNANALGNNVSDCVVRSISLAEGENWNDTYEKLSDLAQLRGTLLDDVNFVEWYLDENYPRQSHYAKTVGEFVREYKRGVFLVTMQGHITCVIDGMIYDTFDPSNRRMWCAWKIV